MMDPDEPDRLICQEIPTRRCPPAWLCLLACARVGSDDETPWTRASLSPIPDENLREQP